MPHSKLHAENPEVELQRVQPVRAGLRCALRVQWIPPVGANIPGDPAITAVASGKAPAFFRDVIISGTDVHTGRSVRLPMRELVQPLLGRRRGRRRARHRVHRPRPRPASLDPLARRARAVSRPRPSLPASSRARRSLRSAADGCGRAHRRDGRAERARPRGRQGRARRGSARRSTRCSRRSRSRSRRSAASSPTRRMSCGRRSRASRRTSTSCAATSSSTRSSAARSSTTSTASRERCARSSRSLLELARSGAKPSREPFQLDELARGHARARALPLPVRHLGRARRRDDRRRRRPRSDGARGVEPPRERRQVERRRRNRRGLAHGRRTLGSRPRAGDRRGGPAARLRALLPLSSGALDAGRGARPLDRARGCGGARRHGRRRERRRRWCAVPAQSQRRSEARLAR